MAPPSSRRPERRSYGFATAVALVRNHRLEPADAGDLVRAWERYVRYRHAIGKTPESTAEHLVRFTKRQIARPHDGRDPRGRRRSVKPRTYVPLEQLAAVQERMIIADLRREAREEEQTGDRQLAHRLFDQADALEAQLRPARRTNRDDRDGTTGRRRRAA